jgi:uncharacterized protein YjbJ (UPF0337 family)
MKNRVAGSVRNLAGQVEEGYGRATGDLKSELQGKQRQVEGTAQEVYGQVKDQVKEMAASAAQAIDAAIDGQGIALARIALAAWDLCAGRLVRPFTFALKAPYAYWIVCPKSTANLPKITTFRDWLLAEAAEDARRLC